MSLLLSIVSKAIFHDFLVSEQIKLLGEANSELKEIIECFFYVSTLNCLSLNKIPMIIFSYDD